MRDREMLENMQLISSKSTFWNKRVFPIIWFGILGMMFFGLLLGKITAKQGGPPAGFFVFLLVLVIIGYVRMKKVLFGLVDEVWDAGNRLIVKNRGEYDEISLDEVMNVNFNYSHSTPRITLNLRRCTQFGKEIMFLPPVQYRWWSCSTPPIVNDLITRVDAARRQATD